MERRSRERGGKRGGREKDEEKRKEKTEEELKEERRTKRRMRKRWKVEGGHHPDRPLDSAFPVRLLSWPPPGLLHCARCSLMHRAPLLCLVSFGCFLSLWESKSLPTGATSLSI